jgi:cell division protein FtsI (penicillin-binding protein 3)
VLHKPNKSIGYYGNIVAAPVFKKIAEHVYTSTPKEIVLNPSRKVDQEVSDDYFRFQNSLIQEDDPTMPNVKGMPLMDAIAILENLGLIVEAKGNGKVESQSLKSGKVIKKGQIVKLQIT